MLRNKTHRAGLLVVIGAVAAATVAAEARPSIADKSATVSHRAVSAISLDSKLPGAVVVARRPSLNEILDLILGDTPTDVASSSGGDPQIARVAFILRRHTDNAARADRIARALVREGRRANIESTLLVGVLMTENPDLEPRATSSVGARGLMQVMPFHAGHWGCSSNDLFDIESNICHGVRILADNLRHSRDLSSALLKYNGCVHGTNTPDCYRYAGIVYGHARRSSVGPEGKVTQETPFRVSPTPPAVASRTFSHSRPPSKKGIIVIPKELLVD